MFDDPRAVYESLRVARPPAERTFPMCSVEGYKGSVDAQGNFDGVGAVTSRMGFTYEGALAQGRLEGRGALAWVNGHRVEGDFADGGANGRATLTWASGDTYDGDVLHGVRHGTGTLRLARGGEYTGGWSHGQRQGEGTMTYADGSVYRGEWAADERHGRGVMRYRGGDCYEGEWRRGRPHGRGEMGWTRGTGRFVETYDGSWEDGLPSGAGTSTYIKYRAEPGGAPAQEPPVLPSEFAPPTSAILNVYSGGVVAGQREGEGSFYYADGSFYRGGWRAGKKHGRGMFVNAVGAVFFGDFADDRSADAAELQEAASGQVPEVYVLDLCALQDGSAEQAMATVKALLLRFNSSFRALMAAYASMRDDTAFVLTPADWWKHRIPGQISLPQFLRLLNDARVLDGGVGVAAALHCVADCIGSESRMARDALRVGLGDAGRRETVARVYALDYSLNYRQFAEALVRLAPVVCVGAELQTLGQKLNALVTEYLLKPFTPSPLFPLSRRHQAALQPHLPALRALFDAAARYGTSGEGRAPPPLTVRRLLSLVQGVCGDSRIPIAAAARALFPFRRHGAAMPPGCNRPATELSEAIFAGACGPGDALVVSGATADMELSVVDFIEALVGLAQMVAQRRGAADPIAVLESDILTLRV